MSCSRSFAAIGEWVREESGIELVVDETAFRRRRNRRGNPTTEGRIAYRGPNPPPQLPKVKLDITADEVVVEQVVQRAIGHQYSDSRCRAKASSVTRSSSCSGRSCVRSVSVAARATSYDVVHMHRHPDLVGQAPTVAAACSRRNARTPRSRYPDGRHASARPPLPRGDRARMGRTCSAISLPRPLPPFADFWGDARRGLRLAWRATSRSWFRHAAEQANLDPAWVPPRAISSWRRGFPFELASIRGRQPAPGRHRLPSGRRPAGPATRRAVLAAPGPATAT